MKKKGFTLIELLAVIVILAVLALILTPMIQDLILNARKSAFERSIDGILAAAEYYQIENPNDEAITFTCDGTSCEDSNGNKLTFKGEIPISGTITISESGVVADNLCNNSFCGSGSRQGLAINTGGSSIPACDISVGTEWIFDYLDETNENRIHTLDIPCKGYYKLEVWGAQGGSYNATYHGGYGGYSKGNILLEETDTLYIVVGGQGVHLGSNKSGTGGFNGGGSILEWWSDGNERRSTGGGATHIALNNNLGELKNYVDNKNDVIIVAGGGGGGHDNAVLGARGYGIGGSGGGTTGGMAIGQQEQYQVTADGATQEAGGGHGSFGQGGTMPVGGEKPGLFSGGGGGWYGGAEGWRGGAGGSGHLSDKIINGEMYCYHCMDVEDAATENTDDISEEAIEERAKKNNGYAKVTYIGSKVLTTNLTWKYKYTGSVQEFVAPATGTYKLEVWGAQGGSYNDTYHGGFGGYSTGTVNLNKNQTVYVVVGGHGSNGLDTRNGGYNGGGQGIGGNCNGDQRYGASGGGATHIATATGELKELVDNSSSVLIVAAGGGGSHYMGSAYGSGGAGGGTTGISATWTNKGHSYYVQPTGGTQSSGGTDGYSYSSSHDTLREGAFGAGGNYTGGVCSEGSGGGGGYYGGGAGQFTPGAGGSSYIGSLEDSSTIAGNESMPTHNGSSTMIGNSGNGYAKITYIR